MEISSFFKRKKQISCYFIMADKIRGDYNFSYSEQRDTFPPPSVQPVLFMSKQSVWRAPAYLSIHLPFIYPSVKQS